MIQWGETPVLNAPTNITVDTPAGASFGWASLGTAPADADLGICDLGLTGFVCTPGVGGTPTPLVGFAAWQRAFAANPGSNYGRIVEHSRKQASASAP